MAPTASSRVVMNNADFRGDLPMGGRGLEPDTSTGVALRVVERSGRAEDDTGAVCGRTGKRASVLSGCPLGATGRRLDP
jgi:hypothetical protein